MTNPATVLDRLAESLRAKSVTPDSQVPPAAVLWTDPNGEWQGLLAELRGVLPELLTLGDYDPGSRTGPAIWLRCVVDGTLSGPSIPEGRPPILYLSGVERTRLRAGRDCPDRVKPLVELTYRGALWSHPKGRDWTPATYLKSTEVGLDLATDGATRRALRQALGEVARTSVEWLRRRRFEAEDFNRMLVRDIERDILRWMGDPEGTRTRLGSHGWSAFRARSRSELDFDPDTEADVAAGARLGNGEGHWADVWDRFAEAPENHQSVVQLLKRSRPADELPFDRARWPDLNDEDEAEAREALSRVPQLAHPEACAAVIELEEGHGHRRQWLWTRLDHSSMARLLEPLGKLARMVDSVPGGASPAEVAATYADCGWVADAAAREALALAPRQDERTVANVVRHLLEPWLAGSANAFQAAVGREPLPVAGRQPPVEAEEDECIVFVDGLRYELGRRLGERLEERGCKAGVSHRWAALPTVTATAKPAVTPVAGQVAGNALGADFQPVIRGKAEGPAKAARLRDAMVQRGYQIIGEGTLDMPLDSPARGWAETGRIDRLGHDHDRDAPAFARAVEDELDRLAERIVEILDVGWCSVRVVTDHGWLWLPGGLPMVSLPRHLTESQWARCAVISGGSEAGAPLYPWHWNAGQWFASPPGIHCFSKRDEYAHGGVTVQECMIPDIRVKKRSRTGGVSATIRSVTWRRLRCVAKVTSEGGPVTADLRLEHPAGDSVAASAKEVADDGSVSLVLADDEHEDADLVFVVTDAGGRILAHRPTQVLS